MTGEVNLGDRRRDRVEAILGERDAYAEQLDRAASGFPSYEVPAFVAERYPEFRPEDPSTWPEPDRCTDDRPWGFSAYGGIITDRDASYEWERYLAAIDSPPTRHRSRSLGCRNRWRDEESRLCGTHVKPWREAIENARKRVARNARELEYLDLAKQLAAYGIEGDAGANGVVLRRDAIEGLLRLLGELP